MKQIVVLAGLFCTLSSALGMDDQPPLPEIAAIDASQVSHVAECIGSDGSERFSVMFIDQSIIWSSLSSAGEYKALFSVVDSKDPANHVTIDVTGSKTHAMLKEFIMDYNKQDEEQTES